MANNLNLDTPMGNKPLRPDRKVDEDMRELLSEMGPGKWKKPYTNDKVSRSAWKMVAAETINQLDEHVESAKFTAWRLVRRVERTGDKRRIELARRLAVKVENLYTEVERVGYHCKSEWNVVEE